MTPLIHFLLDYVIVLIYAVLFVFSTIGAILYCYAYRKMKRSKVIQSLAILLFALMIDSLWWFGVTIVDINNVSGFDVNVYGLVFIKSFLAFGIIKFVIQSIKEDTLEDSISGKQSSLF